ncbi:FMN reductase [Kribbella sp. NBC_00889]|uniref:FMN reductase n=1 Tax=Kribbella sp. NBC_00889 TaxID=2975974 RepID=UPI00386EA80D|nr:FMN reductase [Kribbella sp. NBC_00889]
MKERVIAVVTAGLTTPSSSRLLADQLAAAVRDELSGRGIESRIELIEARDHAHELTNNLLTGFPSAELEKVLATVAGADALIVVSPTFSASYSGLFKMFFDVLDDQALAGKPVLLAATGGTERHSLVLEFALRPLFAYLKAIPVPTAVYAASTDWGPNAQTLRPRITQAASELVAALQHETPTHADPYDNPTPFEDLLNS